MYLLQCKKQTHVNKNILDKITYQDLPKHIRVFSG